MHVSSDYVFDGTREEHREDEPLAPLGVYGQAKAAGDLAVGATRRHYLLRTSWLIGEGHNFVRTMARLADEGVSPTVVDDQVGRLTFTDELARAIVHLLRSRAPYGTYHLTNSGEPRSWAGFATAVFAARGRPDDVRPVSTAEYAAGAGSLVAPRPARSRWPWTRSARPASSPRTCWWRWPATWPADEPQPEHRRARRAGAESRGGLLAKRGSVVEDEYGEAA